MKIRLGWVSNSSSCTYVAFNITCDDITLKDIYYDLIDYVKLKLENGRHDKNESRKNFKFLKECGAGSYKDVYEYLNNLKDRIEETNLHYANYVNHRYSCQDLPFNFNTKYVSDVNYSTEKIIDILKPGEAIEFNISRSGDCPNLFESIFYELCPISGTSQKVHYERGWND